MLEKLVCINKGSYNLTVGKIYDALPYDGLFDYVIVNDKNYTHGIENELFISLKEYRKLKLKELNKYEN